MEVSSSQKFLSKHPSQIKFPTISARPSTATATYEDYLDAQINDRDLYYLDDRHLARSLVEMGIKGTTAAISRLEWEASKMDTFSSIEIKLQLMGCIQSEKFEDEEFKGYGDAFLDALALRERPNRNGEISTIIYIRLENTTTGKEVSSYIDYAHRLKTINFEPIFSGEMSMLPLTSDLSYYNWSTGTVKMNNTTNFTAINDDVNGLCFQCRRNRKVVSVNAGERDVSGQTIRTVVTSPKYSQIVFYDHYITRKPVKFNRIKA